MHFRLDFPAVALVAAVGIMAAFAPETGTGKSLGYIIALLGKLHLVKGLKEEIVLGLWRTKHFLASVVSFHCKNKDKNVQNF